MTDMTVRNDSPSNQPTPANEPNPTAGAPAGTAPAAEPNGPILRDCVMHIHKPSDPCEGVVTKNELCTASKKSAGFVRHIEFDVSGTALAGRAIPGQSIGVLAPGLDAKGKLHKLRLYSLASPSVGEDGNGNVLSTTVKRTIDEHWDTHGLFLGVCSNYLCDLQPGDRIKLAGPSGKRFVLPAQAHEHDYLFFATGTGIAPFRGMIADLLATSPQSKIALVMGSPYATDLLYHHHFESLAASNSNFTYHPALSRESNQARTNSGPLARMYVQDRIAADANVLVPLLASERTLIYICGIAGMELGIFQQLIRTLPPSSAEQYVTCTAEVRSAIDGWARTMLHRDIYLSRRVMMEVYA